MSDFKQLNISIYFASDWHIGAGGGIPGVADQRLLRDPDGYPYIPGRTLRGILRDAHERLYQLPHIQSKYPSPDEIWGTRANKANIGKHGKWYISDAILPNELTDQLKHATEEVRQIWLNELTFVVPRIALDPAHRVKEDHLAFIEVGRKGLHFIGQVTRLDGQGFSENELNLLRLLLLTVRRLGGIRRRGKGRLMMVLNEDGNREAMLQKIQEEY